MRKLLTAGIFGTILGIVGAGTANASIVSSGFLDEKLTEYALSTSLDLKANQSDFTELNTQISDSVDVLKQLLEQGSNSYELVKPIDPEKIPDTISGAFSLLYQYLENFANSISFGWSDSYGNYVFGLRDIAEDYYNYTRADIRKLFDGWDAGNNTSYLGVIGLNDKIGTLPEGITVQGMYDGWDADGTTYLGVKDLNTKIGTLPEGITVQGMYDGWTNAGYNFPGLNFISNGERNVINSYDGYNTARLLVNGGPSTTIDGVDYTGPVYPLWKLSEGIDKIASIETKIGDLPTEIPNTNLIWEKYGFAETGTPIDLPDTIGGMFAMLFSDYGSYNEPSLESIMARILIGFSSSSNVRYEGLSSLTSVYNLIGDSPIVTAVKANTAKIGTVPDGKNLAGMIGTLPDGYDSVGAALTAIKGIAEDAKAAALAAIPDPKQEGSSGKFVLTVDIVGDNATYRWEKIDREGETTTTE